VKAEVFIKKHEDSASSHHREETETTLDCIVGKKNAKKKKVDTFSSECSSNSEKEQTFMPVCQPSKKKFCEFQDYQEEHLQQPSMRIDELNEIMMNRKKKEQ
jgi:hypothetical protein